MNHLFPVLLRSLVALVLLASGGVACSHRPSVRAPVAVTPLPRPEPVALRYPIIFVHGMLSEHAPFAGVRLNLGAAGYTVFEPRLPVLTKIERRARSLGEAVDAVLEETGAQKVHLVGHSLGGIDARYLVSALGYGDRVASLTTIAAPHRGSEPAQDARLFLGPSALKVLSELTTDFSSVLLGVDDRVRLYDVLSDLDPGNMGYFNQMYPDDDRVAYQSFAGLAPDEEIVPAGSLQVCGTIWGDDRMRLDAKIVIGEMGDGLVSVRSAKWGEFRGCLLGRHGDQIGYYRTRGWEGEREFDHIAFYLWLASELVRFEGGGDEVAGE